MFDLTDNETGNEIIANIWELPDECFAIREIRSRDQDAMALNDRSETTSEIRESASTGIVISHADASDCCIKHELYVGIVSHTESRRC